MRWCPWFAKEINVASIAGSFTFFIETNGVVSHDFKVTVEREFDIERGYEDWELRPYGKPEVSIYAGSMLLWVGEPAEMAGWLKDKVEHQIEMENDWGITREDIRDAVLDERETEQFYREHAPGVL